MPKKKIERVVLGEGYPVYLCRFIDAQRLIGLDRKPGSASKLLKISGKKRIRLIAEVLE